MRIIAGSAKGRNISAVASSTRPTSDRAREALFSTLSSEFGSYEGIRVLDLYAGTGAIALEALSRGAELVNLVESDDSAQKAITSNFENIKGAGFSGIFHLYSMSVEKFLQSSAQYSFHFIYVDPPYETEDIDVIEVLIQLRDGGFIHKDAIIAVERNSRVKELSWPEGMEQIKEKKYGQAVIFYGALAINQAENG